MKDKQKNVEGINFLIDASDIKKLTKCELLIYSLIKSYWRQNKNFYMSTYNISLTLNINERHVIKCIKSLENKKLIECERSTNKRLIKQPKKQDLKEALNFELKNLINKVYKKRV